MSAFHYPRYKETGVPWLGSIPTHWDAVPLKRLTRIITEKAESRSFPVALENLESWTGRYVGSEGDYSGEGVAFKPGDILFGKLRPYLAKAWVADQSGEAIGDFHVLRSAPDVCASYIKAFLLSSGIISVIDGSTYGAKMPRASWEFMGSMVALRPPLKEQQAIAAFLDRETAKIDALVAEQERLLILLEEKRQAVIANAVTKGLDPTVPMKDSGVEWLGQVPAHWSVATTNTLKAQTSTITYGIVQAGPDVEGGIPYVRTSDMSGTDLPLTGYLRTTPKIAAAYERSSIKAGDLVIAIRASIGKTLIVPPELAGGNLTQGTAKIEPGMNILGKFLYYVLNSVPCQQHFASIAKGTTFKEITLEMLRKLKVPQPSRAEQRLIVEHLTGVLPGIGRLIAEAETARVLLHERRAALISAAVTGKLDVRAVAPATEPALAAE